MADCIYRSFNARRAQLHGYKITAVQAVILSCSDPLVHAEFQFSHRYRRESFSSTLMGGENGCRFKNLKYSHSERWDSIVLPMTDLQENLAHDEAIRIKDWKYDLIGVASLATRFKIIRPHPKKVWCNEACGMLVLAAYQWDDEYFQPDQQTPNETHLELAWRLYHASR